MARKMHELRTALNADTLHSTRAVYEFLGPLWQSLPVEDVRRKPRGEAKEVESAEWLESYPLTQWQRDKLNDPRKLAILRDWTRTAEDLIALRSSAGSRRR